MHQKNAEKPSLDYFPKQKRDQWRPAPPHSTHEQDLTLNCEHSPAPLTHLLTELLTSVQSCNPSAAAVNTMFCRSLHLAPGSQH